MNTFFGSVWFKIIITMFIVSALFYFVADSFVKPAPKKEIIIAAGGTDGEYYQYAQAYKGLLASEHVNVKILETSGSVENLKLLQEKKADIGFIQSGILQDKPIYNLKSLAAIYYEPVWVFYKNEGYTIEYIIQLIGKKVAVDIKGSGTNDLAMKLLNDNGITHKNTTLLNFTSSLAMKALQRGEIDALFTVRGANNNLIKTLLEDPNINLLSYKRAKAYSQKYGFLKDLTLFEGTIDIYKNLPDSNVNLLSTTANLVAHQDTHDELIRIFLKKVKYTHQLKGIFEKAYEFPNLKNLETEISKEAGIYFTSGDTWLESVFPYWIASNIDRLKILIIPLLTLLIPLLKGMVPLYILTIRSKIFKWYEELNMLNGLIESSSKQELIEIEKKLNELDYEIRHKTKVPLSYMGEYYNLLVHIEMILEKIKNKKEANL